MNGLFVDIHFISIYIVLMVALLVSSKQTHPRQLRAETQINREVCPTKDLAGGKVLHAISQAVGWVKT